MNIKKIIALLLALCMMFALCACGGDTEETEPETTEAPTEEATEEVTEETPEDTEPAGTVYKITVVDEEGNPISGAMVQICLDLCLPGVTNEEGVAEFTVEEADYKVSFLALPEGYDYTTEEQEFYFDAGSYEMTITLKAAA